MPSNSGNRKKRNLNEKKNAIETPVSDAATPVSEALVVTNAVTTEVRATRTEGMNVNNDKSSVRGTIMGGVSRQNSDRTSYESTDVLRSAGSKSKKYWNKLLSMMSNTDLQHLIRFRHLTPNEVLQKLQEVGVTSVDVTIMNKADITNLMGALQRQMAVIESSEEQCFFFRRIISYNRFFL